jgi:hypothetical protein
VTPPASPLKIAGALVLDINEGQDKVDTAKRFAELRPDLLFPAPPAEPEAFPELRFTTERAGVPRTNGFVNPGPRFRVARPFCFQYAAIYAMGPSNDHELEIARQVDRMSVRDYLGPHVVPEILASWISRCPPRITSS